MRVSILTSLIIKHSLHEVAHTARLPSTMATQVATATATNGIKANGKIKSKSELPGIPSFQPLQQRLTSLESKESKESKLINFVQLSHPVFSNYAPQQDNLHRDGAGTVWLQPSRIMHVTVNLLTLNHTPLSRMYSSLTSDS